MSQIRDAYARAIRSKNLRSDPRTERSDADIIGAVAFAGKDVRTEVVNGKVVTRKGSKLAMQLLRLFVGGDREAKEVTATLARMAVGKAYRLGAPIGEAGADLLAGLVIQWHRDSVCKTCGGHGFKVAMGGKLGDSRAVMGDDPCNDCRGSGKRDFDGMFPWEHLNLARWLRAEVEREQAIAGAEAMKALGPKLDL